jgi:hypothetical protein
VTYSTEQREWAIGQVVTGLRKGTPLTVICGAEGMPGYTTIWEWSKADEALSEAIARARDEGFDQIALDALSIADEDPERMATEVGDKVDPGFVQHQKNRVETRLKLLAKWDPKRYGEMIKHAGADGGPMQVTVSSEDAGL